MDEQKTMSLSEALRIIMDKIGKIRVPVREREIALALDGVANDIYECILAVEHGKDQDEPETEASEPEVIEDVHR